MRVLTATIYSDRKIIDFRNVLDDIKHASHSIRLKFYEAFFCKKAS